MCLTVKGKDGKHMTELALPHNRNINAAIIDGVVKTIALVLMTANQAGTRFILVDFLLDNVIDAVIAGKLPAILRVASRAEREGKGVCISDLIAGE